MATIDRPAAYTPAGMQHFTTAGSQTSPMAHSHSPKSATEMASMLAACSRGHKQGRWRAAAAHTEGVTRSLNSPWQMNAFGSPWGCWWPCLCFGGSNTSFSTGACAKAWPACPACRGAITCTQHRLWGQHASQTGCQKRAAACCSYFHSDECCSDLSAPNCPSGAMLPGSRLAWMLAA